LSLLTEWRRSELNQLVGHFSDGLYESIRFRGGTPHELKPFGLQPQGFHHLGNDAGARLSFVITIQVMTFAQVSPHDHDAVGT